MALLCRVSIGDVRQTVDVLERFSDGTLRQFRWQIILYARDPTIVYNYDADLEVSDTCVRSSLLSWVELSWQSYLFPRIVGYISNSVFVFWHSLLCSGLLCLLTYLLLKVDGLCSRQLWMPISCQCRSSLFLNVLIDGASTTSCGSLFHSLTIRKLKKFCLTVVRHLGLNDFNECPLSQLVISASSKNLL